MTNIDNIYIINLKKDTERLRSGLKEIRKITHKKPQRIEGVYGKDLSNREIEKHCSYIYSKIGYKSAIGCALSHMKAWETMLRNKDNVCLIVEDDIKVTNDFKKRFDKLDIPQDFYIVYLGCTVGCKSDKTYDTLFPITKATLGSGITKKTIKINENIFVPALPLALHGYLLSNKGAKHLLDNMRKEKINSHIDYQILKHIYTKPSYSVNPQLIKQKDIDVISSNNIKNKYPLLLNNLLTFKDENGVPMNYKMAIGSYDIFGYVINGITVLFILLGIFLGLLKSKFKIPINKQTISILFLIFTMFEFSINKNMDQEEAKVFVVNTIVSYCLLIVFFKLF